VQIGPDAISILARIVSSSNSNLASRAALTICQIDVEQAETIIEKLIASLPKNEDSLEGEAAFDAATIHGVLGDIEILRDDNEAAVVEYKTAVRLDPNLQTSRWADLAQLKASLGDESLARAIALYEDGHEQSNYGEYAAAEQAYRSAIEEAPDFPWGHNNLAWQMTTCPDAGCRDGEAALAFAKQASDLTRNRYHGILDTLAAAFAAHGHYSSAAKVAERALNLAPEHARGEYEFNLNRYRSEQMWCRYEEDSDSDGND
jgi:tetratricopeptide (TPR) repeat protein